MRFLASAAILSSCLALASGLAVEADEPLAVRALTYEEKLADQAASMKRGEENALQMRLTKCPSSNGCTCAKGTKQGEYYGYCGAVTGKGTDGSWENIFECNPSGGCCDYGASTKCSGADWYDWCPK